MSECPECGAALATGEVCRDLFDALLVFEAEVPDAPGAMPHFYAVATYALQHPDSMNYTPSALVKLHAAVRQALDGRASIADLRLQARREYDGAQRVTRRPGDAPVVWRRGVWPMTVVDVLTGATVETYGEYVQQWARSVCDTLDADQR